MNAKTKGILKETYQTLKREGTSIIISHTVDKHGDPETGETQGTELKTEVFGTIKGFGELFTSSTDTNLLKGDVSITMTANAGLPKIGQVATVDGVPYSILSSRSIKSGATDVAYVIKARSFQETDVAGVFTKQLRELNEGELVRSPIFDDAPIWRVIGQGTYGVGLTLLIDDELTRLGKKTFTSFSYPTRPWVDTYLRNRVVIDLYLPILDISFQEALQAVDVITTNSASSETLFVLSKVEMGFTADPGDESGTFIPYFKTDAYRVCRDLVEGFAFAYWTRDVYGISGSGGLVTLNPGNEHYLRTCCNLRNSLNVAKNHDNVWEIQWP